MRLLVGIRPRLGKCTLARIVGCESAWFLQGKKRPYHPFCSWLAEGWFGLSHLMASTLHPSNGRCCLFGRDESQPLPSKHVCKTKGVLSSPLQLFKITPYLRYTYEVMKMRFWGCWWGELQQLIFLLLALLQRAVLGHASWNSWPSQNDLIYQSALR